MLIIFMYVIRLFFAKGLRDPLKKREQSIKIALKLNLAVPTFPARRQASIIGVVDFTSVFGMGTGVSPQLYPPEIL